MSLSCNLDTPKPKSHLSIIKVTFILWATLLSFFAKENFTIMFIKALLKNPKG
jgi:hypothetical protein